MVATLSWLTVTEYLCHKWPRICTVWRPVIQFSPFSCLLPKAFKLFRFSFFRFWGYLMKVIPETHRVHYIRCLRFYHSPVLSSFITCSWICNKSNTTGVTSGTGTDYPFAAPELTLLALVGFVLLYLIFLYSVL
jgi:hypothetical protein